MYIVFIAGVAPRFPPTQLLSRALWMLRKTAESQTLSYVLWLATFHCLETPFCLFLLGFLLASPIASSLLLVMLQWATWREGDLCSPLYGDSLCEGLLRLQHNSQEVMLKLLRRGIDHWLFTAERWFFLFCCLCQPIIGSTNKMKKQTNK